MYYFGHMSICIAFNLSDGLVMAVDSATTMSNAAGETTKVFLDADKLFQLGNLRIGIATYGVAALDGRTIGSFIREFALLDSNKDLGEITVKEIVERLRVFFFDHYKAFAERIHSLPFDQIPSEKKGRLGLVVGGFSPGAFQSELWEVGIPAHASTYSAKQWATPGTQTFVWFASAMPVTRYLKGFDPQLRSNLFEKFKELLGRDLTSDEAKEVTEMIAASEISVQTGGMPIQSGIACARWLVDFVLGHYRFAETHPIVGGRTKIGVVAYDHAAFRILE
jgi:hypothetical protein